MMHKKTTEYMIYRCQKAEPRNNNAMEQSTQPIEKKVWTEPAMILLSINKDTFGHAQPDVVDAGSFS
jgi:hypothetical protein